MLFFVIAYDMVNKRYRLSPRFIVPVFMIAIWILERYGLRDIRYYQWRPTINLWAWSLCMIVLHFSYRSAKLNQGGLLENIWKNNGLVWGVNFALLGLLNLFVADNFSMDTWVTFKLITGITLIFIPSILQMIAVRLKPIPQS